MSHFLSVSLEDIPPRRGPWGMLFGVSGRNGPVQPVLAVGDAGDDVAHHIVSGGVDHCGRGDLPGCRWPPGWGRQPQSAGEEDGADDVLTDVASAGHAGHAHRGEHRHSHHRRGAWSRAYPRPWPPGQRRFSARRRSRSRPYAWWRPWARPYRPHPWGCRCPPPHAGWWGWWRRRSRCPAT